MTTGPSWASLVSGVLDDDQRTRRADVLLSHVTVWLIVLGSAAAVVTQLMLATPWWVPTGAGGVGAVSAALAMLRRRRKLGSADRQTQQ
jgi:hypothetical protein